MSIDMDFTSSFPYQQITLLMDTFSILLQLVVNNYARKKRDQDVTCARVTYVAYGITVYNY